MFRYLTIKKEATVEQVIEKSRFIAHVKPVETREEAEEFFNKIRTEHRNATHNVPALVLGEKCEFQWASDDGEPQGTSGPPILQMLVSEGITKIAVMVTRYFGGIKLGTGGLVRAYTNTAKLALEAAGVCEVRERNVLFIKLDYTYLGKLQNLAQNGEFELLNAHYEDMVTVELGIEPERTQYLLGLLANITGGKYEEVGIRQELIKI
ncbi:MAG: YigZ family protein [Clostridiales bacterium]|nr:YigZ family protein [Clostridiales bacterium]